MFFNPNNKKCDTCINFVNIEYSLDMECSKFSHDHQEEKGMKGLCKSWELEK